MIDSLTIISILVTLLGVAFAIYQIISDKRKIGKLKIEIDKPLKTKEEQALSSLCNRVNVDDIIFQLVNRLINSTVDSNRPLLELKAQNEKAILVNTQSDSLFIPQGVVYFSYSTQRDILTNADKLYIELTETFLNTEKSTFIFITPYEWDNKDEWINNKKKQGIWDDVKVYDANILGKWIEEKPQVFIWLDIKFLGENQTGGIQLAEDFWEEWATGPKYDLNYQLLLGGREIEINTIFNALNNPCIFSVQDSSREEALAFIIASFKSNNKRNKELMTRTFIINNQEIFRKLSNVKNPLILIPRFDDLSIINRAIVNGHSVLIPISSDTSNISGNKIVLPIIPQESFINELSKSEIEKDKAKEFIESFSKQTTNELESIRKEIAKIYSKESARNITILKRQLGFVRNIPKWAKPENVRLLIPALIIGRWDESFTNDKLIIAHLANEKYEEYSIKLNQLLNNSDSPLVKIGSKWRLASPLDAWTNASKYLIQRDFELLRESFNLIMGELNPAFELNGETRRYANLYGKGRCYSNWIREGVTQSLILTSLFGNELQFELPQSSDIWVDNIISNLLNNNNPFFWKSIEENLPLIAEASPFEFLNTVQKLLVINNSPILSLFDEDKGLLSSQSYHTGLLWALEGIAWFPEFLASASLILAKLAANDPGGSLSNRPINSLIEIFKPWHPQTLASLNDRISVLKLISTQEKSIAWVLLTRMLPKLSDSTAFPTSKMRWRKLNILLNTSITYDEIWGTHSAVVDLLISIVDNSESEVAKLIEDSDSLNIDDRIKILTFVESRIDEVFQREFQCWHALRKLLSHHRSHPSANWALQENELKIYEKLYEKFQPKDEISKNIWMFNEFSPLFPEGYVFNSEFDKKIIERQKFVDTRRLEGLKEIYLKYGIEKIAELSSTVKEPWALGETLANLIENEKNYFSIFENLNNDKNNLRFIHGFISKKYFINGIDWIFELYYKLKKRKYNNIALANLFVPIYQNKVLWDFIDSTNSEIKMEYWISINPQFYHVNRDEKSLGLRYLLEYKRFISAIEICSYFYEEIPSSIIIEILEKAGTEKANENIQLDRYHFEELFNVIEKRNDVEKDVLIKLEWIFLPILSEYNDKRSPKLLHEELSKNPVFFIEVLKWGYKPDNGVDEVKDVMEKQDDNIQNRALQAFQLLHFWKKIPGLDENGIIDNNILRDWVGEVRGLAVECSRLEVADMHIGQVLAQYPEIPEREISWPPEEICSLIEEINSDSLKNNFSIATFNKRGFSTRGPFDGGDRERKIAKYFNELSAKQINKYPNVAAMLSRLAKRYEEDAKRMDNEAKQMSLDY